MSIEEMQLAVTSAALDVLPGLQAWAFQAEGLEPRHVPPPGQTDVPNDIDPSQITTHPGIATWRNAFRAMGLKASEQRSSVEQLVRRAAGGHNLETGIWTVDLYNAVSIKHLAPMGGYDAARLSQQPLLLRTGAATDRFVPLGGDPAKMQWSPRTVCYAQGETILCWGLNHRDSKETALQQASDTAIFVSEAVDKDGEQRSMTALADLADRLRTLGAACSAIVQFRHP